jgi:GGDEF domain-containing protein
VPINVDGLVVAMNVRLRTYSYCVGGAFWIALVAWLLLEPASLSAGARLAPLVAVAVAGEELVMRRRGDGEHAALSLSAVAHVAAAVLLTPVAAALAAALGVLISDGLRRDGRQYLLINSAMFGGSTWLAAIVYRSLAGSHVSWTFAAIPALLVLISVRYLATSVVFAGGMAAMGNGSFGGLVGSTVIEEVPAACGEGSLGVLVAFGFGASPMLLPFLLPLLAALFFSRANLERLRRETQRALQAMADVVDARDPSTTEHSERVAELVERFVAALDLPRRESERLVAAARFHDLGKIAVDTSTLASASRLTDDEVAQIRMHPRLSAQLLRPFSFAREISEFAALHHERWDGTGYFGVDGSEIPIEAHVLVAADSYDAMTSARPYRSPLSREEAVAELLDKAGSQFHPTVARAFAAVLLDEPLRDRLSESELVNLRKSFARIRVTPVPARDVVGEPRVLAMAALVSTLVSVGIPGTPWLISIALGSSTCGLLCYWLATQIRVATRRARVQAAVAANASPEVVIAAAGFAGWAAFAAVDGSDVFGEPRDGVPPVELREVRSWLLLGAVEQLKRLSTGTWVVRSQGVLQEQRLVVGLQRRPHVYELELAQSLAEAILESQPPARPATPRHAEGERALALIELHAFERLRHGAGQLVAERVIAETERRLRSVLRVNDAVLRISEDVFAVSMVIDSADVDALERRLTDAVTAVPVPQRLEPLDPRVIVARAADAHRMPELAEVEERLLPSPVPA